ncbi:MAG: SanA/YdcF family protein [Patescibacteria group bacterium]
MRWKKLHIKKLGVKILFVAGISLACFIIIINVITSFVRSQYAFNIVKADKLDTAPVIIILGASLKEDGTPSLMLQDRLDKGIELLNQNKAPIILISGDDGKNRMNEVFVMKQYLLNQGVNPEKIYTDGQGYRTYESCKRAHDKYDINEAILVSQKFHLKRALYLCNHLGVKSKGVAADTGEYDGYAYHVIRDWFASFKAWIDLNIWAPSPPV